VWTAARVVRRGEPITIAIAIAVAVAVAMAMAAVVLDALDLGRVDVVVVWIQSLRAGGGGH
jgi:hypothetical protein